MTAPRSDHASNPDQLMARALGVCWHSPTSDRWPCQDELPMTPVPSSPVALLDQLDELRAKATPGPWHVAPSGAIDAGDYDTVIGGGPVDCMAYCYGGSSTIEGDNLPADAALIVAAVNALPELIADLRKHHAAVRAVLDLHAPLDRGTGPQCQGCATHVTFARWPCPTVTALSVTP